MSYEPAWEELDHPADVRLRITGRSLKELLRNAARGMIETMVDPATVRCQESMEVEVGGDSPESLLINWLQEIHFRFDADRFVPARVEIDSLEELNVRGQLNGEFMDRERHGFRTEIKAVTWHDLEIVETADGYEVKVLFDV
ncbi:MAG: archease [Planctomycetota bacterium]